ncbi:MAG: alpha-galactosidase [Acidobacteria bacterium]|nr:alpha-galactosidase [Acidobacteriota bacterium]
MEEGFSRRSVLQAGVMLGAELAFGRPMFEQSPNQTTWSIKNTLIQRDVVFAPGVGLYGGLFQDLGTRSNFVESTPDPLKAFPDFSFVCDGHECRSNGGVFELIESTEAAFHGGHGRSVRLRHHKLPLEVAAVYTVYDEHAACRKYLLLKNTGTEPLQISHLVVDSLAPALGPENELTLLAQYGAIPREIFYTGRSEDCGLMLANGRTGIGLAILNEAPGYMKRTEIAGWDVPGSARISAMYDTDLMPFQRRLAPSEEFTTASVSIVLFRRGDGFNDPQWRVPAYTSAVLERRVDNAGPPWIYNTWEPFERSINQNIAMELIDAAGTMGMDVFTIDDGWQQEYGDNAVDPSAFPDGLDPILKAIESRGMRLGLWIPLAAIGTKTNVYQSHPEWATKDIDGNLKTTSTMAGQKAVMCMASPFRMTAAQRINDAIERFRLAYVKLDLTTIFNAYGEAPGCWAKGHDHADWAESLHRIYEGIRETTAAVYTKHPDVLLDLTFELWGQKHIIDAGLLAAGDLDWMSNVDDRHPDSAGPRQARQLLYARAASMPVESMLIGNLHAELPTIQESFATAIGSAPLLLGDLRKLSAADRTWYGEKIRWFKQLRRRVRLSESFFALGSWRQASPAEWDGFARLARSGDGVVAVFRNKSGITSASIQLPLIPEGSYRALGIISGREIGTFDRAAWTRGVSVPLDAPAEVLELRRV